MCAVVLLSPMKQGSPDEWLGMHRHAYPEMERGKCDAADVKWRGKRPFFVLVFPVFYMLFNVKVGALIATNKHLFSRILGA